MSVSPVIFFGIFKCKLFELLVHLSVEVVPEKEGPKPEQSVHLLRLADPQPFPLLGEEKQKHNSRRWLACDAKSRAAA